MNPLNYIHTLTIYIFKKHKLLTVVVENLIQYYIKVIYLYMTYLYCVKKEEDGVKTFKPI